MPAETLTATRVDTGEILASFDVPDGSGWCILWHHSVEGFEVADCYENREGKMVLVRSHQPDFAAGLGHIIERGTQVSDGMGGYFIEDINEAVPSNAYILRPVQGSLITGLGSARRKCRSPRRPHANASASP